VHCRPWLLRQVIINLPTYFNKWRAAPVGFAKELMERAVAELGADNILYFELGNEPRYCECPALCGGSSRQQATFSWGAYMVWCVHPPLSAAAGPNPPTIERSVTFGRVGTYDLGGNFVPGWDNWCA